MGRSVGIDSEGKVSHRNFNLPYKIQFAFALHADRLRERGVTRLSKPNRPKSINDFAWLQNQIYFSFLNKSCFVH